MNIIIANHTYHFATSEFGLIMGIEVVAWSILIRLRWRSKHPKKVHDTAWPSVRESYRTTKTDEL